MSALTGLDLIRLRQDRSTFMSQSGQKQDWDDLAELDPLWAIHSRSEFRDGKWGYDRFFETGEQDVGEAMMIANRLGFPGERKNLLDFGCGVGRLTRAFAAHFDRCCGLDISDKMIEMARTLNCSLGNCEFMASPEENLHRFASDSFDMVYSNWVLQHLTSRSEIKACLSELVRVLKPDGLLAFQVRFALSLRARLNIGNRAYRLLRRLGLRKEFLYATMRITPIRMIAIPEPELIALMNSLKMKILESRYYSVASGKGAVLYVTKGSAL
jgi:ubiquinone/menaquinone biosynthesis C-methylase UbiE